MGKVRAAKRDIKKFKTPSASTSTSSNKVNNSESQLKTTMGKISADISAISLGLPRAKILKKTNNSSNSNLLASNFASRVKTLNKQKKKVTFLENLISENLKEQSKSGDDAKHYFKVIHPSAIERRKLGQKGGGDGERVIAGGGGHKTTTSQVKDLIPNEETLISSSIPTLKKIIKKSVKNKKIRLKATRETFKKKMELLKLKKEEVFKAKQRQQTVIVGDIHPMLESLPQIPSREEAEAEVNVKNAIKEHVMKSSKLPKKIEKFSVKKTQQAMIDSLKFFEASGVGVRAGLSTQ